MSLASISAAMLQRIKLAFLFISNTSTSTLAPATQFLACTLIHGMPMLLVSTRVSLFQAMVLVPQTQAIW